MIRPPSIEDIERVRDLVPDVAEGMVALAVVVVGLVWCWAAAWAVRP